jgi:hypothetical protein
VSLEEAGSALADPAVVYELERGDYPGRGACLELIAELPLLAVGPAVVEIAETYIARHVMPADPAGDALHLALAPFHRCERETSSGTSGA